jgi:hypothetical protein
MTETPPPGYITDDGEGVASPGSHSSGESRCLRSFLILFTAQFLETKMIGSRIKRYTSVRIFRVLILNYLLFLVSYAKLLFSGKYFYTGPILGKLRYSSYTH